MTSLIDKLLARLTPTFDRSPAPVLALRLAYNGLGTMVWTIDNDTLTTTVNGAADLTVDLTQYTIGSLAGYLAAQPHYVIAYVIAGPLVAASALAMVEGSGDVTQSNGDHLFAATNPNWAYMSAASAELLLARAAITALPLEMATTTADGEWLDLLGSWYAVPRLLSEPDSTYGPRIPAEVFLPRQNNAAAAAALIAATGQPATVTNAVVYGHPTPIFDGAIRFDSAHLHNAVAGRVYNLFDVTVGYALLSNLSPQAYGVAVAEQIDRLRAAGTHLRNLTLGTSALSDGSPLPTDSFTIAIVQASLVSAATSTNFGLASLPSLQSAAASLNAATANLAVGLGAVAAIGAVGSFSGAATQIQQASARLQGGGGLTGQAS